MRISFPGLGNSCLNSCVSHPSMATQLAFDHTSYSRKSKSWDWTEPLCSNKKLALKLNKKGTKPYRGMNTV